MTDPGGAAAVAAPAPAQASWSSDVNQWHRQKNYVELPANATSTSRQKALIKTHMGRDYDIISCATKPSASSADLLPADTKAARRLASMSKEDAAAVIAGRSPGHVRRGVERELKHSYHAYDVVTHKLAYGVDEQAAASRFPPERKRGVRSAGVHQDRTFDLVSNTALYGRERDFEEEQRKRSVHRPRLSPRQRQTDIVSHRFKHDHEERLAAQQEENRRRLAARKKPTDFNPVVAQWCDPAVEARERAKQAQKLDETREAVRNHTYRVSSLVRHSEGHAVDFLTGKVHNPEFLLEINKRQARGMMQRTKLRQEFDHRRDVEEAVRETDVNLVLARYHPSKRPECVGGEKAPSTLARLEASMRTKPATTSSVYLSEGPRTSHERVLNVKPSEVAAAASTYEGRRKLILPTIEKAAGNVLRREELVSVLRKPASSQP